jgi:hypothetical protein
MLIVFHVSGRMILAVPTGRRLNRRREQGGDRPLKGIA